MKRAYESIGSIRRARGVSLATIARSTAISMRYLQAIDKEDFDSLPGGVFNTSYIRQFARAIAIEEDELLRRYREHVENAAPVTVTHRLSWKTRMARLGRAMAKVLRTVRETAMPAL